VSDQLIVPDCYYTTRSSNRWNKGKKIKISWANALVSDQLIQTSNMRAGKHISKWFHLGTRYYLHIHTTNKNHTTIEVLEKEPSDFLNREAIIFPLGEQSVK
jgi:hypothetical protein